MQDFELSYSKAKGYHHILSIEYCAAVKQTCERRETKWTVHVPAIPSSGELQMDVRTLVLSNLAYIVCQESE